MTPVATSNENPLHLVECHFGSPVGGLPYLFGVGKLRPRRSSSVSALGTSFEIVSRAIRARAFASRRKATVSVAPADKRLPEPSELQRDVPFCLSIGQPVRRAHRGEHGRRKPGMGEQPVSPTRLPELLVIEILHCWPPPAVVGSGG